MRFFLNSHPTESLLAAMLMRLPALLFALAIWLSNLTCAQAQESVRFIVRDTGQRTKLVFDPYMKKWVATANPASYIRAAIDKQHPDGFGSKLAHKDFQNNTPVTDAAVSGAKYVTNTASKVPFYGSLAKPFQRLAHRFDKARQTNTR
jgi:hypothetical protein